MKITELKIGQMFIYGRLKKYRQYLEHTILDDDSKLKGKVAVYYDNCKEMFCDPNTEVEVSEDFYFPVQGFDHSYSTGLNKIKVDVCGHETFISHLFKDGGRLSFVYTIKTKSGKYVHFDIRDIPYFPELTFTEMYENGISIVENHIKSNSEKYLHLIID